MDAVPVPVVKKMEISVAPLGGWATPLDTVILPPEEVPAPPAGTEMASDPRVIEILY
jgi:hypothetical protein